MASTRSPSRSHAPTNGSCGEGEGGKDWRVLKVLISNPRVFKTANWRAAKTSSGFWPGFFSLLRDGINRFSHASRYNGIVVLWIALSCQRPYLVSVFRDSSCRARASVDRFEDITNSLLQKSKSTSISSITVHSRLWSCIRNRLLTLTQLTIDWQNCFFID